MTGEGRGVNGIRSRRSSVPQCKVQREAPPQRTINRIKKKKKQKKSASSCSFLSSCLLIVVVLVLRFTDVPCDEDSGKKTGCVISRRRVDFALPPAVEFVRLLAFKLVTVSILLSFEMLRLTISFIDAVLVPVLFLPPHLLWVSPARPRPLLVLIIAMSSSFRRRSDKRRWRVTVRILLSIVGVLDSPCLL
jgi:hypothetical protein